MKTFVLLLIGVFMFAQYSDASPRLHLEADRSGLRLPRSTKLSSLRPPFPHSTSNNDDLTKREKILLYSFTELVGLMKYALKEINEVYNNMIEAANKENINKGALRNELKNFTDLSKKFDNLPSDEAEEYSVKLFELYDEHLELKEKYDLDNILNATKEQVQIHRLIDENMKSMPSKMELYKKEMLIRFTAKVQVFVDSMTPQERREYAEIIDWFNKFKNQTNFGPGQFETMFEFIAFPNQNKLSPNCNCAA